MLGYELKDQRADFFTFRHTGASHMAKHALNGSGLIHVVNMMGDTKVGTVRRHYFNFELADMAEIVDRWSGPASPDDPEPSRGSTDSPLTAGDGIARRSGEPSNRRVCARAVPNAPAVKRRSERRSGLLQACRCQHRPLEHES